MHKYGESKTTQIMMATVRHVTSSSGLGKFQAAWFLLNRGYMAWSKSIQLFFFLTRRCLGPQVGHLWPWTSMHMCEFLPPTQIAESLAISKNLLCMSCVSHWWWP